MQKVGIYVRLSDEDRNKRNQADESESIQNQKSMLLSYAMERGWAVYKIYCDEDYSGADKNRPEWNELIQDAEDGKFNVVLCKTQSRFSRELEMVEKYIHGKFLEWDVRFVSIVDNADTANAGNKKSRQINGLINEWYLEDLSDNVRRTLYHKKQKGEWTGSFAPYGYAEDPNDKNHLVVDPIAAEVVKDVFDMYLSGMGYAGISKKLNSLGIPSPYVYKQNNGSKFKTQTAKGTCNIWAESTIYQMLRREIYTGTLVQGIVENISYKNKKQRKRAPEDWIRVPNTHEPIISMETWNTIQERLKVRKRQQKYTGTIHIFAGKIFCGCCTRSMSKMSYQLKNGQYSYFKCRTRVSADNLCDNSKTIRIDVLSNKVKDEINRLLNEHYDPNTITIHEKHKNNDKENSLKTEQQTLMNLIEQNQVESDSLCRSMLRETITQEQFNRINSSITQEIDRHQNRLNAVEKQLAELQSEETKKVSKETLLKKYRRIEELDRDLVDEFVQAIYVGKVENNQRKIEIKWKF